MWYGENREHYAGEKDLSYKENAGQYNIIYVDKNFSVFFFSLAYLQIMMEFVLIFVFFFVFNFIEITEIFNDFCFPN